MNLKASIFDYHVILKYDCSDNIEHLHIHRIHLTLHKKSSLIRKSVPIHSNCNTSVFCSSTIHIVMLKLMASYVIKKIPFRSSP